MNDTKVVKGIIFHIDMKFVSVETVYTWSKLKDDRPETAEAAKKQVEKINAIDRSKAPKDFKPAGPIKVVELKGDTNETAFEEFVSQFPENEPRICVFNFDVPEDFGVGGVVSSPLILKWVPSSTNVWLKMCVGPAGLAMEKLVPKGKGMQCDSPGEPSYDEALRRAQRKT